MQFLKLCSTALVPSSVREVPLPLKQAIIVDILVKLGGQSTGYEIVKASEGALTLGGVYTHLNRLESKGVIESTHEVDVQSDGRRLPKRHVRLRQGVVIQHADDSSTSASMHLKDAVAA